MSYSESDFKRQFPSSLLIGPSSSAFQMEDIHNPGGRKTDWDEFNDKHKIVKPGEIGPDWSTPGNFEKDIQTMSNLGMKVIRLSIEWGRVIPEEGKIDQVALQQYRNQVSFVQSKNMIPILTYIHFSLPAWIAVKGGWQSPKIVPAFLEWSKLVTDKFGDVPYFITINEPNTLLGAGYQQGYWPPEKKSLTAMLRALYHMKKAHHQAYEEIKQHSPKTAVGISNMVMWLKPNNPNDPKDRVISNLANLIFNKTFPFLTRHDTDFMGLDFYTGFNVKFKPTLRSSLQEDILAVPKTFPGGETVMPKIPEGFVSNVGWPIVPHFFLDALTSMYQQFHKPIIIAENGFSDSEDQYAAYYFLTHLVALHEAILFGVKVLAYCPWSITDNLEWREGYKACFGLQSLDKETGQRQLRNSAMLLGEVARTSKINVHELISKYLPEQEAQAIETIKSLALFKTRPLNY